MAANNKIFWKKKLQLATYKISVVSTSVDLAVILITEAIIKRLIDLRKMFKSKNRVNSSQLARKIEI